jgi:hypothetical protein
MGWAMEGGELLALAAGQFDAFVTVDRNLAFQQRLPRFPIAVIMLRAVTNRLADLRPLVPELLEKFRAAGWALAALSVDDPGRSQPVRGRPEPRDARGMGPLLRKGGCNLRRYSPGLSR